MRITHERKRYNGNYIICDTLIFYGKEIETVQSDIPFAKTWLTFLELFKTSERNPKIIISTWERFLDNAKWSIPLLPDQQFQLEVNRLSPTLLKKNHYEAQQKQTDLFDAYVMGKKTDQLSDDQWNNFLLKIEAERKGFEEKYIKWVEYLASIKKNGTFNKELNRDLKTPEGRAIFLEITKKIITQEFSIDPHIIPANFGRIELFTNVFNCYVIDFFTSAITPTPNDLIDVVNMIYVRPGDKYWTKEKKWLKYIDTVNMNKYLFAPGQI